MGGLVKDVKPIKLGHRRTSCILTTWHYKQTSFAYTFIF